MFTIMPIPSGFSVIDRFPNATKMNSDYFVTNLLVPFEQLIFTRGTALYEK
jgi:hypothetical protein